jgi:hypothetical protein
MRAGMTTEVFIGLNPRTSDGGKGLADVADVTCFAFRCSIRRTGDSATQSAKAAMRLTSSVGSGRRRPASDLACRSDRRAQQQVRGTAGARAPAAVSADGAAESTQAFAPPRHSGRVSAAPGQHVRASVSSSVVRLTPKVRHTAAFDMPPASAARMASSCSPEIAGGRPPRAAEVAQGYFR